jgi:hypothetical protein
MRNFIYSTLKIVAGTYFLLSLPLHFAQSHNSKACFSWQKNATELLLKISVAAFNGAYNKNTPLSCWTSRILIKFHLNIAGDSHGEVKSTPIFSKDTGF